jgi:hypothetical protein
MHKLTPEKFGIESREADHSGILAQANKQRNPQKQTIYAL